jgi:carbon monoxide dehydrogenase subunit G
MIMARYVTKVRTARFAEDAFAYMSDLRNFAQWDPGVKAVTQAEGDGPGLGAAFDVVVATGRRDMTLRYRTTTFEPPKELLVVATSKMFTSEDRVMVETDASGTVVTYDAELRLNGLLRFADAGLGLVFKRIGDRAAAGLRRALDGQAVA